MPDSEKESYVSKNRKSLHSHYYSLLKLSGNGKTINNKYCVVLKETHPHFAEKIFTLIRRIRGFIHGILPLWTFWLFSVFEVSHHQKLERFGMSLFIGWHLHKLQYFCPTKCLNSNTVYYVIAATCGWITMMLMME